MDMHRLVHMEVVPAWGVPFKLYSAKGTYLGLITIPRQSAEYLMETGCVRWHYMEDARRFSPTDIVRVMALYAAPFFAENAVQLAGATIEEVEKQRGFTFAPSAGYLRSLIE